MKIMHVASFIGNIGDNASHKGLYQLLRELGIEVEISQREIRYYYKNYCGRDAKRFDQDFIHEVNNHDLTIIGGGGFLDYWIADSATGCTFDIEPDLLVGIKKPLWFLSVGSAPHHRVPDGNRGKFRRFLDACITNTLIKIVLRNDGSIFHIKQDIGASFLNAVEEQLDHGFFYNSPKNNHFVNSDYIAVNICDDQIRMQRRSGEAIEPRRFYTEMAEVLSSLIEKTGLHIVLVPHIHSDLRAISNVIDGVNDMLVREKISVAPCWQGNDGADYVFNIYRNACLTLGTRYHANVCNLAMGNNVIALQALDRVGYVYERLGISKRAIRLDRDFKELVVTTALSAIESPLLSCDLSILDEMRSQMRARYKSLFDSI